MSPSFPSCLWECLVPSVKTSPAFNPVNLVNPVKISLWPSRRRSRIELIPRRLQRRIELERGAELGLRLLLPVGQLLQRDP